jgi:hypothetical protein
MASRQWCRGHGAGPTTSGKWRQGNAVRDDDGSGGEEDVKSEGWGSGAVPST